ncbi:co-chaperone YbbN [Haloprofundus sp. MHR1]|uniref:thioredoxin family protein n=1 Tax=Haloprofundus sp. MHR1 TaxID=2572921 RepID=UPI0010BE6F1A|nr:thioredoxin family protein [Haloprofundus sp. MHR1]QCJ46385.1 thioredoxin family protein [Haloprofundus sp. MHR1]
MTADAADTDADAQRRKPIRLSSGEELDDLVAEDDLVLVDLYTKGCTLCQSIEPVVGNVARATDVTVAMLNPRDDPDLIERFDVRSVPTLLLFEDGELVGRLAEGFQGTDAIVGFVEEHSSRAIAAE